jgi:hypothetical protein
MFSNPPTVKENRALQIETITKAALSVSIPDFSKASFSHHQLLLLNVV